MTGKDTSPLSNEFSLDLENSDMRSLRPTEEYTYSVVSLVLMESVKMSPSRSMSSG